MARPFKVRSQKEVNWIKEWFRSQVVGGRLPIRLERLQLVETVPDVQRLIDEELDGEARGRLQKALSYRRTQSSEDKSVVKTKLDQRARRILLAVAAERGITTSELIVESFEQEYLNID